MCPDTSGHTERPSQPQQAYIGCLYHESRARWAVKHVSISAAHLNELKVTLPPLIGNTGQMWVSLLTIPAHHAAVIVGILSQEALGVVVAVNVDFGQCIVDGRLLTAFMNPGLQPGE